MKKIRQDYIVSYNGHEFRAGDETSAHYLSFQNEIEEQFPLLLEDGEDPIVEVKEEEVEVKMPVLADMEEVSNKAMKKETVKRK